MLECGHEPTPTPNTPGYGVHADGTRACFPCCADEDRAEMTRTGRAVMYLAHVGPSSVLERYPNPSAWEVTNWPGTLRFKLTRIHNSRTAGFGGWMPRTDVHFVGPDGALWYGRHQGHNNTVVRVRRVK